ncbi:MAG TPA: NAD-binding protein [Streptosporangiaceae bacterium]
MTAQPEPTAQPEDHVIIGGANALTARMAEELTARYGLTVTVIVPSAATPTARRMAALADVRILEHAELDADAFLAAGLPTASGLAILHQDDLGNFHAALRAQEIRPDIRMVVAISNAALGYRIQRFFADCAVLSEAQMAAPSLVAAALGEPAPSHVRLGNRTLYVARREDVGAGLIVCGLAETVDAAAPRLLPPDDLTDDIVLAVADGSPRNPLSRRRRHRLAAPLRLARRVFWTKMGLVFGSLLAVLVAGFVLLALTFHLTGLTAIYLTFLDAAGAAVTGPQVPSTEKVAQFLLTFDGMAFLPLVTAAIVGSRIQGNRASASSLTGHVIVAGLGDVGSRVVGQLHDLGYDVVGIDKRADASGMAMARRLGVPVVVGDTNREETLRSAAVGSCQAIVSVTDSDIVNLETALNAEALSSGLRVVIRLNDDDLAARVEHDDTVSRSTSYLAAPAFAAAVLDHQVRRTIAVGRHVLLLAEVAADGEARLAGRAVADVHKPGTLRVVALRRRGADEADWSPDRTTVISTGDQLIVLATRAGLSAVLTGDS